MTDFLQDKLAATPAEPGVYLLKNRRGHVIYVGKAVSLKKRLASYFARASQPDLKTAILVKKVTDFDTIITGSEKEALILESNLIKKHRPRYNVILKDDKRYPSLCLTIADPYPYLSIVRKIKNDGNLYFGPYTAAGAVAQTVKLINKTFKLRKCRTKDFRRRQRPCLNYQMGACLAPCCLSVDPDQYRAIVAEVTLFLSGRTTDLLRNIETEMKAAADGEAFEHAAVLRDKLFALKKTLEKQVVVATDLSDRDVVAVFGKGGHWVVTLLVVRGGFLQGVRHFGVNHQVGGAAEVIRAFLKQFYENTRFLPPEILVSVLPEDTPALNEWLSALRGKKVGVRCPRRGEKARLVGMAMENAATELKRRTDEEMLQRDLLARLQRKLQMQRLPERIECLDNSNLQGQDPVAGLVVFMGGRPYKPGYRRYIIRNVPHQDDYAYMTEVLRRRFSRPSADEPLPDLLMVDGGKGQLNMAVAVITALGLQAEMAVIGIAKKEEDKGELEDKIYLPGRSNPVNMRVGGEIILFLRRIRDEAHRFAVSFHRQRHRRSGLMSRLDGIPGIGAKRKKTLLVHFGSVKKIRAATVEELTAVPGISRSIAQTLRDRLNQREKKGAARP